MADRPSCMFCGRITYDPDKRERPWARGVRGGRQVLVCPHCQSDQPDWQASLDACPSCASTRLTVTLGEVICRLCGHVSPAA